MHLRRTGQGKMLALSDLKVVLPVLPSIYITPCSFQRENRRLICRSVCCFIHSIYVTVMMLRYIVILYWILVLTVQWYFTPP